MAILASKARAARSSVLPPLRSAARQLVGAVWTYVWAFRLGWQVSPRHLLAILLVHTAQGFHPLAEIWLLKALLDQIASAFTSVQAGRPADTSAVLWLIGARIALIVWNQVMQIFSHNSRHMFCGLVEQDLNIRILRKASQLDLAFFENPSFYDKLTNAKRALDTVYGAVRFLMNTVATAINTRWRALCVPCLPPLL